MERWRERREERIGGKKKHWRHEVNKQNKNGKEEKKNRIGNQKLIRLERWEEKKKKEKNNRKAPVETRCEFESPNHAGVDIILF